MAPGMTPAKIKANNLKFIPHVLSVAASTLIIGGCATQSPHSPSVGSADKNSSPASEQVVFKVALLTTGPVNDGGWNQSAYEGLQRIARDMPAKTEKEENLKDSDFESAFRDYASRGYNIIFAHGDEFSSVAAKVAPLFPKTLFVTTGGTNSGPNLVPIHFATEEGTYLQGMEAAYVSKTGKGGFVGGQELPPVKIAADAFSNGAKSVNPKFIFNATYINGWTDPVAARAQTEALLNSGCDVISHNCDAAAKGLFDAAASKPGVHTFGVNADENAKAPNVLSSAVLDIPKAFDDIANKVKAGHYVAKPLSLGLRDKDVALVDNPKLASVLTPVEKSHIENAAVAIATGRLKVVR